MNNVNPLELWRLLEQETRVPKAKKLEALAAMADAPPEDFQVPLSLPVQNKLPGFKVGNGSLGSQIAGLEYGVAGPVLGQSALVDGKTIGELLVENEDGDGSR